MCGITGWVDWTEDLRHREQVLHAMTQTLLPRGPDASAVWTSPEAALGHSRLSVIDLAGGSQPMEIGDLTVVYSGEIYNFRELRQELETKGCSFNTESDTEVLVRMFAELGPECVARLNGMFAFAVWNKRTKQLFLVRDRLGIKPLYYFRYPNGIVFGSEPKAIIANPMFVPQLDAEGVAEIFAVPGARTPGHGIYRNLAELRPAHMLQLSHTHLRTWRYWQLESREHEDGQAATFSHIRALLEDIVDRQLISDVPVSTLLSGGLDSSVLTALVSQACNRKGMPQLPSFSMDYDDDYDTFTPDAWRPSRDGPFAELMAQKLGTPHTNVHLDTDQIIAAQSYSLAARDLPGWGDLDISLAVLFEAVRRSTTVALSGEAADEVFGGYPWYSNTAALKQDFFPWLNPHRLPSQLLRPDVSAWVRPDEYAADRYTQALAEVPRLANENAIDHRIREAFYLGLTRWLPLLLDRKDRMSMRIGLEVRVPFCDHRLLEYVWNVPWTLKHTGDIEKGLLRQAAADIVPSEIISRRKCAPPACRTSAYTDYLRQRLIRLVEQPSAPLFQLVDRNKLRELLSNGGHIPGPTPGPKTNFSLSYLLDVDGWLRTYSVSLVN